MQWQSQNVHVCWFGGSFDDDVASIGLSHRDDLLFSEISTPASYSNTPPRMISFRPSPQEVKGGVAAIASTLLKHVLEPFKEELDLSSLEKSAGAAPPQ